MFEKISIHTPRQFVPADLNTGDWAGLAPLFEQLEQQLSATTNAEQLEQVILNWEELSAAIAEESSKRYIAMTCQTNDKTAEQDYLDFVEKIEPEEKQCSFRLAKALSNHPHRDSLPSKRYEVFTRDSALEVELFRPENVELETETTKIVWDASASPPRAAGVQISKRGATKVVRARKEVIVCCGAVNSPLLLLKSGVGPRAAL